MTSIAALGLRILVLGAGRLSVAQGAVMGSGAYVATLASRVLAGGWPVALIAAMCGGCLVSLPLCLASARLSKVGFTVFSFAFSISVLSTIRALDITGGSNGLDAALPATARSLSVIAGLTALMLCALIYRLTDESPFGQSLAASVTNERVASSLGISASNLLATAIVLCGALTGLAGFVFVVAYGRVDTSDFSGTRGLLILSIVLIAGQSSITALCAVSYVVCLLQVLVKLADLNPAIRGYGQSAIFWSIMAVAAFLVARRRMEASVE